MNRTIWKELMLGTIAGLSLLTSPAMGKVSSPAEALIVKVDNRGPGSMNSGPGFMDSGRDGGHDNHVRGHRGGEDIYVAQAGEVRQEDRRADRQLDRREDRREDRQVDRREHRQEDRQFNRREDHRSNASGELRGLDRADSVAGDHRHDGRENARMMQMERPHRPERMEQIERPERPEHPDRPERPERPERSGRS